MSLPVLWIVDDDQSVRWVLEKTFSSDKWSIVCFDNAITALDQLEADVRHAPDVVLSDIRMPGMNGLVFLTELKKTCPDLPVIIMTAHSDLDAAVSSFQTGAFEYLPKPFDIYEVINTVNRALTFANDQKKIPQVIAKPKKNKSPIIGESPAMQEVFRIIGRLSQSPISVLINGESGTGKELVAQALHQNSPRSDKPFIALNMAAIPKDLIETELFGHEKGSFTGANSSRQGRFEQANGGTLFLDEIGDMPFEAQTRLLRVLAEGEFYRIGGQVPVRVEVRIIAATHQNLENLVAKGTFREDLYHRLNVIRIQIPALRERPEDIAALTHYFLERASKELNVPLKHIHPDTLRQLARQPWQGNIRQLENTCRWLTVMSSGLEILPSDLPVELQGVDQLTSPITDVVVPQVVAASVPTTHAWQSPLAVWVAQKLDAGENDLMEQAQAILDQVLIETTLAHTGGQKNTAAERLGLGRNTLTRKIQQLGIEDVGG